MGVEIERKFRVRGKTWKTGRGTPYQQGYLSRDRARTVRVRIAGKKAFLTVKGASRGVTRAEFEYAIPPADAEDILKLCDGPIIAKTRYDVSCRGTAWIVDEFRGENAGLVLAEVELLSEDQAFQKPAWLGAEVSRDPRYFNSNLAVKPYSRWRKGGQGPAADGHQPFLDELMRRAKDAGLDGLIRTRRSKTSRRTPSGR